jgi:hypothetical protein
LPEVLSMSDRIAIMHAGTVSGVLDRAEATQDRIMALALERAAATVPTPPPSGLGARASPGAKGSGLADND